MEEEFIIVVACLIVLAILAFGASLMEKSADLKGYSDEHIFAICFWLGIIGYLYVISLPDKSNSNSYENENKQILEQHPLIVNKTNNSDFWTCPSCGSKNHKTTGTCGCGARKS